MASSVSPAPATAADVLLACLDNPSRQTHELADRWHVGCVIRAAAFCRDRFADRAASCCREHRDSCLADAARLSSPFSMAAGDGTGAGSTVAVLLAVAAFAALVALAYTRLVQVKQQRQHERAE